MKSVKRIRDRLGLSQKELAELLDKPQSSISTYENGAAKIAPETAQALIDLAKVHGLLIDFNHIYGDVDLPPKREDRSKPVEASQPAAALPIPATLPRRRGLFQPGS